MAQSEGKAKGGQSLLTQDEIRRAAKLKRKHKGGGQVGNHSLFADIHGDRTERRDQRELTNRNKAAGRTLRPFRGTSWEAAAKTLAEAYCGLVELDGIDVDDLDSTNVDGMDDTLLVYVQASFARAVTDAPYPPRYTPGQGSMWFELTLELVDEYKRREYLVQRIMTRFDRKAQHHDLWRDNAKVAKTARELAMAYCGLVTVDDTAIGPNLRDAVRFYFAAELDRLRQRPSDTTGQQAEWFASLTVKVKEQALRRAERNLKARQPVAA